MKDYLIGFSSVILTSTISSLFTTISVNTDWFRKNKPSFTPPNWVFPIVWTILYVILGIAFSVAIKTKDVILVSLFISNLILNVLWCFFFFYKKDKHTGVILISLLLINTLFLIMLQKDTLYKLLLTPYMLWLSFATFLNYKYGENID